MKSFKKIFLILLIGFVASGVTACSAGKASNSGKTSTSSAKKTSSVKKVVQKTATLAGQTFTTKQGTFLITENHVTASATKNKQVLILKYTFTNTGKSQLVPSDCWYKYVKATQTVNGKPKTLEQGSLPFSTSATNDDNLENASVSEIKPNHHIKAEGSWQLVKNGAPVKVSFYDTHHQLIGTRQYSTD
ncbi:DUF5067 domain-containing protein [Pediococcus inopinatus]|uniref:DUF5067 domain-containing protein n=1 Tax=Pediococcus inopinatus TaxID=114090 RepID=A0ABZ0Q597_9LACO|nr:DUF5067 domain-containing protein [Pediococcus inopinatus]KRN61037.1 hypothetical protein IV83_GL001148 [Pediococcus inopinatus]WPC20421.1 DUF5067 domain-containing protein [Pediococcus inopinatus]WPC22126.1 DUF5067 domain-containing protein [Pediococcus inopinatus]WPP08940.1 DUF5067 domain-containing protein [Pediococcus inopinatus]